MRTKSCPICSARFESDPSYRPDEPEPCDACAAVGGCTAGVEVEIVGGDHEGKRGRVEHVSVSSAGVVVLEIVIDDRIAPIFREHARPVTP